MANWSEFFSRLGGGLSDYASFKEKQKDDDEQKKFRQQQLGLQQSELDENRRYHTESLASDERRRLQDEAQHQTDQLFKAGIVAPEGYTKNAMAGAMPETPGYDVGGMAINAVRNAGRARTQEFQSAVPSALNEMYKSKELMHAIPGGGYAFMDAGVRSNLDVAANNAQIARENRKSAHEIALIRASAARRTTDPVELERVRFMQKGIADRMKPQLDPDTGLATMPGMKQGDAYRAARAEWEQIKGNTNIPKGGATTDTLPSDHFTGHENADFDAMAVANELQGVDHDTARAILESQNYSEEEIKLVLGDDDDK